MGDGAVVGAGTVVSKSVPAYAVVAGNPAQIIRFRFEPDIRTRLLALSWWEWEDDEIWTLRSSFMADVESFLDDAERLHKPASESDVTRRLRETPVERVTPHRPTPASPGEQRISELEEQIAGMRSTAAWRWATRYWRIRANLRRLRRHG